ncbi:MAG: type II secretion system protein GspF [Candidatus Omnitrophica bacterium CG11_big_fil_rev_8_21_14_0_20_63_9]|nr:MAG: type II secretion system protein GspF [Candidatus Omnitrophica bacterium CG11_big_fil_rev_8_21_14_0_20_63_9]
MPRFTYRAKDQSLHVIEGTIEAESEAAAISRLGSEGVFPITLAEIGTSASSPLRWLPTRVSQRTLAYTTRQLADLLAGGLPLLNALNLLARQTEQAPLRRVIEALAASVRDGRSFSDALSEFPGVFPPLYRSMVRAGEVSGGLEATLARLAELGEHEAELRSKVVGAAAYPCFILCVAAAMTIFLLSYVIPKLSLVFLEAGQALPLPTRFLLAVSHLFTQWWWALALVAVGLLWLLRQSYVSARGRAVIDRAALALPAAGVLVRKLETARFTRNLGTMVSQGVPILQALDVVANNVGNAVLRRSVSVISDNVREGASLASALSATGQFPVFVSNMIAVGEESGTVDGALLKIASTYEREVDRVIRTLTTLLEPLLLLGVGGIVMCIVLAMLLPVFQIELVVQ